MKKLKKWSFLTLFLAGAITFSACGHSTAKNDKATTDNTISDNTVQNQDTGPKVKSNVQKELDQAKSSGKAAFIVVIEKGTTGTEQALKIAKEAVSICKNAVIVKLYRDDASNTDLVNTMRLSGAPLPLILVTSPKGYPAGGYGLDEATAESIAALVPTPKLDEVYESITNKIPVFLIITKKTFTDREIMLKNCNAAVIQLKNKATIVEVDMNSAKEAALIKQLNVKTNTNKSWVWVMNASGQTTDTFEGVVEPDRLVAAANKVIRTGGCCPGGSSSGCGTKK